jgi:heat-inducible transcriptional repressor
MKVNIDFNAELDDRSRDVFRRWWKAIWNRRRSARLAQSVAHAADVAVAGLGPQRHERSGIAWPDLRAACQRRPPADPEQGLRFFVDAFMQVGEVFSPSARSSNARSSRRQRAVRWRSCFTEASQMLSGMTRGAGLVLAAKQDSTIRHIEFIRLEETRRWWFWSAATTRWRTASWNCPMASPPDNCRRRRIFSTITGRPER